MKRNYEAEKKFEFIVRLCNDVLLEALHFGDRRWLSKFESAGRRFHLIIENCLNQMPFLRVDIEIDPWFLHKIYK